MSIIKYGTHLFDRFDGVSILASALAHTNDIGKFKEYMRFFELAFKSPISKSKTKLTQFLKSYKKYGYTKEEIDHWIELRNPAIHHVVSVELVVLSNQITPIIQRIEQAALDILFNKEKWNDRSKTRRHAYYPSGFTASPHGEAGVYSGTTPKFTFGGNGSFNSFSFHPGYFESVITGENLWCPNEHDVYLHSSEEE